jgi:hypothetical protein
MNPRSGMGKKSESGSGINNTDQIRELRNNFLGKILKLFDADPSVMKKKFGSGMEI